MPELYWRLLEIENTKPMSLTIQNTSPILNSEVLVYIMKADGTPPSDNSPYFTLPPMIFRNDLRLEPGDKVYYTTRNQGEMSYTVVEINQTHNYEIPTQHQSIVVSGEYKLKVPEGSMVSIQSDPKRNSKDAFLTYHIGSTDDASGRFHLYGAQQVSFTFTTDTEITFYSENDHYVNVLITASQNVSQLSKEMQDKLDKLIADLTAMKDEFATKDQLKVVFMKTLRDDYIPLEDKNIENGIISTGNFYCVYEDIERDIEDDDILKFTFIVNIISQNQDLIEDCSGSINILVRYKGQDSEVIEFSSTNAELTKLTKSVKFNLTRTAHNSDMSTRNQRCSVEIIIKDELKQIVSGKSLAFVKSDNVPLRKVLPNIHFDDNLIETSLMNIEYFYQNVVFVEDKDINSLILNITPKPNVNNSEIIIRKYKKDLNDAMLERHTLEFDGINQFIQFSLNNKGTYDLILKLVRGIYPPIDNGNLYPSLIETFEDIITGSSTLFNVSLLSKTKGIESDGEYITFKAELLPIEHKGYTYINKIISLLSKDNGVLKNKKMRVMYSE